MSLARIKKNAAGVQLYPKLEVRFFFPGNEKSKLHVLRAKPGTGHTSNMIEKWLEDFAEQVEQLYPTEEYELVELSPARFNVVHRGSKPVGELYVDGKKIDPELVAKAIAADA